VHPYLLGARRATACWTLFGGVKRYPEQLRNQVIVVDNRRDGRRHWEPLFWRPLITGREGARHGGDGVVVNVSDPPTGLSFP